MVRHTHRRVKHCKNCAIEYNEEHPECKNCTRNPQVKDRWRPDMTTCKELVIYYAQQKSPISAPEIAKNIGSGTKSVIIEAAIAELIKEGKLKVETSVVIL